ncbi:serine hydrolase [Litoribacter alkaliphilus]|uniref:Serine hydrolase n=1 Tax=Litoribacter ruber TaxID=702568 RepID=A0AAP2G654_9BACT|nr:serine hydrolase [Litoribacter alkaliphilus]MBS9525323.1 serine hydrolase [Litoribacter alkaliphilus]
MKKLGIVLALVAGLGISGFAQQQDSRLEGIEAELEKVLDTWNAPGFSVVVVEKDQVVYSKGFGYRDYENELPATPQTLYAIGSSTKAFTAALLGKLRDEGKLKLEDSPIKHIPELQFKNNELNNMVTIRDLMTHRTGLPRHDISWYLFSTDSRDSLVQRIAHHEPFAKVRETWYYNNFMYLLQGVISEKLYGKSWEDNIAEQFFEPLGMSSSMAKIDGLKNGNEAAFGYKLKSDSIITKMDYYDIAAMGPAGSINSNVEDMAKWLQMWIAGGKYNGEQILSPGYIQEAISPHMVMSSAPPTAESPDLHLSSYGYGWMVSSYKGHYRVEHGGNIDGFSANVAFFPTDSVGIAVLVNQNGSSVPNIVRNIISDKMLGVEATDWNKLIKERADKAKAEQDSAQVSMSSSQKKGTRPTHNLREFEGDYTNPGYGKFTVELKNDSLFANAPTQAMWLKHVHYNVFMPYPVENGLPDTLEMSPLRLNFRIGDSGDISALTVKLEPTVDALEFRRKPKEVEVDTEKLKEYEGEYELGGQRIRFYLKENDDSTLYLFVPGQPEYDLLAIDEDAFTLKIVEGFTIRFERNEDEKIQEAVFVQPNGTFRAKRK